jgi:hypothetical protein
VIRNPAEFVEASGRAPPTALNSALGRDVERGAIDARLPA